MLPLNASIACPPLFDDEKPSLSAVGHVVSLSFDTYSFSLSTHSSRWRVPRTNNGPPAPLESTDSLQQIFTSTPEAPTSHLTSFNLPIIAETIILLKTVNQVEGSLQVIGSTVQQYTSLEARPRIFPLRSVLQFASKVLASMRY